MVQISRFPGPWSTVCFMLTHLFCHILLTLLVIETEVSVCGVGGEGESKSRSSSKLSNIIKNQNKYIKGLSWSEEKGICEAFSLLMV
ncbi:hypothetical protein E2C01_087847 [Portunus trituberculatus]|uniref:Uncharacterized protein n=1 Tax=Portunus trituberculatus TaxID=210409 RepID=A0A5B7J4K8_PORTR|nr:hypothetical protein [Portunus trituberculatus]